MSNSSVVLLVHGMGTHKKGEMKKDYKKALTQRLDSFGLSGENIVKGVDCVEFNYSDYFDAVRTQFADNAEARKKGFKYLTGGGFDEKLVTQLTNFEAKFGKDSFFYTHWLDVILYGTMYFGEVIRKDFLVQFEKLLKKYGHQNVHVVSHSLGTALVHDAFAKYYRTDSNPYDDIPDKPLGAFNVASLWTFANVSRLLNILNQLADPLTSSVATGNQGCTNRFVNVYNQFDPFTWFKRYQRTMQYGVDIEIEAIRKVNTHDFFEYITHPDVTRGISQVIYKKKITPAQLKKGVKAYEVGDLGAQVKELKDRVIEAKNNPSVTNLKTAIDEFKDIQALIEALKDSVQ